MHTLFNGLIKEKFVVLNFAEAFRLHTTSVRRFRFSGGFAYKLGRNYLVSFRPGREFF